MKNTHLIIALVIVSILIGLTFVVSREKSEETPLPTLPVQHIATSTDPKSATYIVNGEAYALLNGRSEKEITPNAASKMVTTLFGEPVYGDLNNDGVDDAVVLLVQNAGGSGTFYYAAVAVGDVDGSYVGTNAIFLGDRIAPQTLEIRNGVFIANYADRKKEEPMSARPSVGVSTYMTLLGDVLEEVPTLETGEQVSEGYITIGHEALSFRPCGEGQEEYWIMGDSPALKELRDTYNANLLDSKPYTAFFGVVVGKYVDAPKDGFGADYAHAISIKDLVRFDRTGNCKSDSIVLTSHAPGSVITSPLTISGRARGNWYFEASFPAILTDWDGRIIAQGPMSAKGEWMTTSFVPFEGTLEFVKPIAGDGYGERGFLILKKDNPSGLPEHDDAIEIPLYFER